MLMAIFALTACDNPNYPPELPLPDEYTTCAVDEDCTTVQLGCCDHCNGGTIVATNADSQQEVEDEYSERCADDHMCSLVGCETPEAACEGATCELLYTGEI